MSYNTAIYNSGLPHRAVAVYCYLRERCDKEGKCWPSIRTIGRDLKLSRSTVKRALHDLEHNGFLRKEERFRENGSNSSNLYLLTG